MKIENKKGFTLVELLIVMAIIGILIAIAIIGLGSAQATARNQARMTSLKGVSGLLETYYGNSGGTYPLQVGTGLGTPPGGTQNNQLIQFENPSDGTIFQTGANICSASIAPSARIGTSGIAGNSNLSSGCTTGTNFTLTTGTKDYTDSTTEMYYFYIPFQSANVYLGSQTNAPITGYIIGGCLENSGIFVYTSNGSNAPYKSTANTLKVTAGSNITVNCG